MNRMNKRGFWVLRWNVGRICSKKRAENVKGGEDRRNNYTKNAWRWKWKREKGYWCKADLGSIWLKTGKQKRKLQNSDEWIEVTENIKRLIMNIAQMDGEIIIVTSLCLFFCTLRTWNIMIWFVRVKTILLGRLKKCRVFIWVYVWTTTCFVDHRGKCWAGNAGDGEAGYSMCCVELICHDHWVHGEGAEIWGSFTGMCAAVFVFLQAQRLMMQISCSVWHSWKIGPEKISRRNATAYITCFELGQGRVQ